MDTKTGAKKPSRPHLIHSHSAMASSASSDKGSSSSQLQLSQAAKRLSYLKPLHIHHSNRYVQTVSHSAAPRLQPMSKADADRLTSGGYAPLSSVRRTQNRSNEGSRLKRAPTRPARPGDVLREKERGRKRDLQLRDSLNDLTSLAHTTTRNLDDMWYAILEKIATMRATIAQLQQLADETRELSARFERDGQGVAQEVEEGIEGLKESLAAREGVIGGLESRLERAKGRVNDGVARLEKVMQEVDGWGRREETWQNRMSTRLRMLWIGLVLLGCLLLGLLVLHDQRTGERGALAGPNEIKEALANKSIPSFVVSILDEVSSSREARSQKSHSVLVDEGRVNDDGKLSAFDEL